MKKAPPRTIRNFTSFEVDETIATIDRIRSELDALTERFGENRLLWAPSILLVIVRDEAIVERHERQLVA